MPHWSHSITFSLFVVVLLSCGEATATVQNTDLLFETYLNSGRVMLKVKTLSSKAFDAALSLRDRASVCNIDPRDAAFTDSFMRIVNPEFDVVASETTSACTYDLYFLFRTKFRAIRLAFDRLVFMEQLPAVKETEWLQCITPGDPNALCTILKDGVKLVLWGEGTSFDENTPFVTIKGVDISAPHAWTTNPNGYVDCPMQPLLSELDFYYDVWTNRVAFLHRVPSPTWTTASALFGGVITFVFVTRLLMDTTTDRKWLHWGFIAVALAGIAIAFVTRTRVLAYTPLVCGICGAVVFYLILELYCHARLTAPHRESENSNNRDDDDNDELAPLEIKPDLAMILISLILSFYAITSHAMIIIPALLTFMFTMKTVVEMEDLYDNPNDSVILAVLADLVVIAALWRYVVAEFLETSSEGNWFLQIAFVVLAVLDGAAFFIGLRRGIFFATTDAEPPSAAAAACNCPPPPPAPPQTQPTAPAAQTAPQQLPSAPPPPPMTQAAHRFLATTGLARPTPLQSGSTSRTSAVSRSFPTPPLLRMGHTRALQ